MHLTTFPENTTKMIKNKNLKNSEISLYVGCFVLFGVELAFVALPEKLKFSILVRRSMGQSMNKMDGQGLIRYNFHFRTLSRVSMRHEGKFSDGFPLFAE